MEISRVEMIVTKMGLLRDMYKFLQQNKYAYNDWIAILPEIPTEQDLYEIAENKALWDIACEAFGRIVKQYKIK